MTPSATQHPVCLITAGPNQRGRSGQSGVDYLIINAEPHQGDHTLHHFTGRSHLIVEEDLERIELSEAGRQNSLLLLTYPLTAGVVGAPQMTLQPVSSIFLCSPLPFRTWRTPGLSIPWCCLPTSFFFCLPCLLPPFTVPYKMVLARPALALFPLPTA